MGNYIDIADELDALIESGDINVSTYASDTLMYGAYAAYQGYRAKDFEDWVEEADEQYVGMYLDDEEFAAQLYEDIGALDSEDPLYGYIDWERVARDLFLCGDYFESEGFYFRSY